MDKKIAGLPGAAAALTTVAGAHAATTRTADPPTATNYRDLLEPIPNALAMLKADDARLAQSGATGDIRLAQYYHHHHHHHHHHHNGYYPGAVLGGVIGGIIASQPRYYGPPPNCYWTLGRPYWNGYGWVRPRVRVCQ